MSFKRLPTPSPSPSKRQRTRSDVYHNVSTVNDESIAPRAPAPSVHCAPSRRRMIREESPEPVIDVQDTSTHSDTEYKDKAHPGILWQDDDSDEDTYFDISQMEETENEVELLNGSVSGIDDDPSPAVNDVPDPLASRLRFRHSNSTH
ncbi:hypothetical protein BGW42_005929, partial [Actinomortierella wolfii]